MAKTEWSAEQVVKNTVRGVLWFLLACVLVYPGDWVVWLLHGRPMGSVEVSRMTAAPLKNGKEDYYFDGMDNISCSESLFGWSGMEACWRVRKHPEVITQY